MKAGDEERYGSALDRSDAAIQPKALILWALTAIIRVPGLDELGGRFVFVYDLVDPSAWTPTALQIFSRFRKARQSPQSVSDGRFTIRIFSAHVSSSPSGGRR